MINDQASFDATMISVLHHHLTAPAEMARQGWRRDRKEREEEEHRGQRGGGRGHKAAQCGVHNQIEGG